MKSPKTIELGVVAIIMVIMGWAGIAPDAHRESILSFDLYEWEVNWMYYSVIIIGGILSLLVGIRLVRQFIKRRHDKSRGANNLISN